MVCYSVNINPTKKRGNRFINLKLKLGLHEVLQNQIVSLDFASFRYLVIPGHIPDLCNYLILYRIDVHRQRPLPT